MSARLIRPCLPDRFEAVTPTHHCPKPPHRLKSRGADQDIYPDFIFVCSLICDQTCLIFMQRSESEKPDRAKIRCELFKWTETRSPRNAHINETLSRAVFLPRVRRRRELFLLCTSRKLAFVPFATLPSIGIYPEIHGQNPGGLWLRRRAPGAALIFPRRSLRKRQGGTLSSATGIWLRPGIDHANAALSPGKGHAPEVCV